VRDRVKIVEMHIEDLKFGKEAAKEVQMYRGKVMAAARGYGMKSRAQPHSFSSSGQKWIRV